MAYWWKKFPSRIAALDGLTDDFDPAAAAFGRRRPRLREVATEGNEDGEDRHGSRFGVYGPGPTSANAWFLFENAAPAGSAPEFCIVSMKLGRQFAGKSFDEAIALYRAALIRPRDSEVPAAPGPLDGIGDCKLADAAGGGP